MTVREIMSTEITKATPENTLVDIAASMRDKDIGVLPVLEGEELKGIVTDRDIVVRAVAAGKDPSTTLVQEVVSGEIETVEPDADVEEAADLMATRQIRRLPVVEQGRLVGMVSLGDIAIKHKEDVAAHTLRAVSEGIVKGAHLIPRMEAARGATLVKSIATTRKPNRGTSKGKKAARRKAS